MSDVRYEDSDVAPGAVGRYALLLAVAVAVVGAAVLGLMALLRSQEEKKDPPPAPLADQAPGRLPPEPRLQPQPFRDLALARENEAREVVDYGWVDRGAGTVSIPIEDAIILYVRRANGAAPSPAPSPRQPTDAAPVPPPRTGAAP